MFAQTNIFTKITEVEGSKHTYLLIFMFFFQNLQKLIDPVHGI